MNIKIDDVRISEILVKVINDKLNDIEKELKILILGRTIKFETIVREEQ